MKRQKNHFCVPLAITLPIIFAFLVLASLYTAVFCYLSGSPDATPIFVVLSLISLIMALLLLPISIRRIEITKAGVICKGLFKQDTFVIDHTKCNIGMDYHKQDGRIIWWIYLCEDMLPKYKPNNPANRINSVQITPGFIRIMYSEEVYFELLEVLPKHQRTALITARRYAGFEK